MRGDPEVAIAEADRKSYFDMQGELHRLQAQANEMAERLVEANDQLAAIRERMRDTTKSAAGNLKGRSCRRLALTTATCMRRIEALRVELT